MPKLPGKMPLVLPCLTALQFLVTSALAAGPNSPAPQPLDGAALYSRNCAGCHGPLENSAKRGRPAAAIRKAITDNTGGMGFLNSLSYSEIQAIATALKQDATAFDKTRMIGGFSLR